VRAGVVTNDAGVNGAGDIDALLDRLADTGDAHAFDVLYRRFTGQLFSTALRLTRDPDEAADLVHDTWVRAVESLHGFARRSAFRTWITGILINRHRENERARRRELSRTASAEDREIDDVADPGSAGPLDATSIDPIDLETAIAALPAGFRQVLVLHDVEGFTHEEIGEALGTVAGTSKSQLARARRRLRELLGEGVSKTNP
jgi:RNA polymerase sigma-70 factor (ECF subfamily)